jgi:hypothetical protein
MTRYLCLLVVWVTAVRPARADDIDDLVAKGQALAQQAEWTQAIAAFKQADAKRPRAANACMIGLAYTRRELWAQAELFFARCHERAKDGDPLPDWLGDAETQLAAKEAGAGAAAITLAVTPAGASISISSFEADELVAPGTIHLTPGRYTVDINAPGYVNARREVVVEAGKAQTVEVALAKPAPPPPPPPSPSVTPWIVIGAGVVLGTAGLVSDEAKLQPLKRTMKTSFDAWAHNESAFDRWQAITVGLWAGGAVVAGVGAYLLYREHASVTLDARLDRSGGAILVGWRR